MNKKWNLFKWVAITMLICNIVFWIFFLWSPPQRPPRMENSPRAQIIHVLHLDENQIILLDSIIDLHQQQLRFALDNLENSKSKLYVHLNDSNQTQSDSIWNDIGHSTLALEQLHYHHFAAIKGICRPDQIKDFQRLSRSFPQFFRSQSPPHP